MKDKKDKKDKQDGTYTFTHRVKVPTTTAELAAAAERVMGGRLTEVALSDEQQDAFKKICAWFDTRAAPVLTLGGYAGTGKSTLISVLAGKYPHIRIAFCALTGKATSVLRKKLVEGNVIAGNHSVSTVHSLMYTPVTDKSLGAITGWERKDFLDCDLIILDEASMVDEAIFKDLTSYNIPILAVGDHGQLPPIQGSFNLMERPTLRLETVHRQAEDSPILALSAMVRRFGQVPRMEHSLEVQILHITATANVVEALYSDKGINHGDVAMLCYTNAERCWLNELAREARWGAKDQVPRVGDLVMCLRNTQATVFNGMRGTILELRPEYETEHTYYGRVFFEDDSIEVEGPINKAQFGRESTFKDFDEYARATHIRPRSWEAVGLLLDYGYTLTVHKSQGSEFEHTIVVNDFPQRMDLEAKRRTLYTAVTRCSKYLVVLQQ